MVDPFPEQLDKTADLQAVGPVPMPTEAEKRAAYFDHEIGPDTLYDDPPESAAEIAHTEPYRWPEQVERAVSFLARRVGQANFRKLDPAPDACRAPVDDEPCGRCPECAGRVVVDSDPQDLSDRARAILTAAPLAPKFHRTLGLAGRFAELGKATVRCRICKRRWTCQIEDDYFGGTNKANGLCLPCALVESIPDADRAALEGTIVAPPALEAGRDATAELPATEETEGQ
jgi:hypothetical protein